MGKAFKTANRIYDRGLSLFFVLLFLIGAYCLYDTFLVYRGANDDTLLNYKPGYDKQIDPVKPIKGNMVGWLTIDDTAIDYPVMQGEDNVEYLNKDPYGAYSLSGSLFLDCRNDDSFEDDYSLIYGHHMERGMMFGALDEFLDEEYFKEHTKGALLFEDQPEKPFRIFAVLETDAAEDRVFAPTETTGTLDYVLEHAQFLNRDFIPDGGQKLLAFSTCKYPDTAERTVVFAYFS